MAHRSYSIMKCAEVVKAGEALNLTTRNIPDCPPDGVLIRTLYAGLCHSDIHVLDDTIQLGQGKTFSHSEALENNGHSFEGLILGHEICGVVEEVGKNVDEEKCSLSEGETVIVYPWRGCQVCEACQVGDNNMCEDNQSATTDIGQGPHAGGFAEYVAVPEYHLAIKCPASVPPRIACLLPCSACTSYNSLLNARKFLDDGIYRRGVANLLVIGCGGLGMWVVILVKSVFCDKNVKVICADLDKDKLDAVASLGADDIIQWNRETPIEELITQTTVSGYNKIDAAIDFVGHPRCFQIAFGSLHHGGTIVEVGLSGGEVTVPLPTIISKNITIQGIRTLGYSQFKSFVEIFDVQNADIYPPVSYFSLDQINEAIEKLRNGKITGRAVIKFI